MFVGRSMVIQSGFLIIFSRRHSSLLYFLMPSLVKSAQVANETPMLISGAKNVSLSPTLSMSFVLLAPSLSNSVLSISKITKHLSCFVTFHSTHCVFRDSFMKMTIGIGKETGGLYYLEGGEVGINASPLFSPCLSRPRKENIGERDSSTRKEADLEMFSSNEDMEGSLGRVGSDSRAQQPWLSLLRQKPEAKGLA
ncbi:hypothetical protein CK203_053794 [Vitis vinifera]|uniref:Uncharacterized protein n=1 Tax=Vitis vinifera TaxID=29760 RepID=A0A438GQR4_VITVI|nr:hypothetical protein CK203_053794 [Vitis vinifera]